MSTTAPEKAPCAGCGAPLEPAFARRDVTCGFCAKLQPNPVPLPAGQEVLATAAGTISGMSIGRVLGCRGPDAIDIESGTARTTHRVEDLTPVVPVGDELPGWSRVFVDHGGLHGWQAQALVRIEGPMCVVKHPQAEFQDAFFDKSVHCSAVRRPVEASLVPRRRQRPSIVLVFGVVLVVAMILLFLLRHRH